MDSVDREMNEERRKEGRDDRDGEKKGGGKMDWGAVGRGLLASGAFAFVVLAVLAWLVRKPGGDLITSLFLLTPLMMGAIGSYWWRNMRRLALFWAVLLDSLVAVVLSALIAGEGAICLVILFPLLVFMIWLGAITGRAYFLARNETFKVSLVVAVAAFLLFDLLSPHQHQGVVADEIVIDAPVEKVWPHVVAFERIEAPAGYWLFRAGLPMPVATTVDAYRRGASRKCIFSNGVVFDEVMRVFEPNRELTFDIVRQPADPEIMGHLTLQRGQFLLRDNGDGTTTLTGTSWYKLHIFPTLYFDLWAASITRNVHVRVMEHIKELAEGR